MMRNIDPIHEVEGDELPHLSDRSNLSSLYNRSSQKTNITIENSAEILTATKETRFSEVSLANLISLIAITTSSISYIGTLLVMNTVDGISTVDLSPIERLSGIPLALMVGLPWVIFIILIANIFSRKDINLGIFLVLYSFFVLPLFDIGMNIKLLSLSMFLYLLFIAIFNFVYIRLILKIIVSILNDRFAKEHLAVPLVMLICVWILAAIY